MNHYQYDEINVGQEESFTVSITEQMLDAFKGITGDINPMHNDQEYAQNAGFDGRIAYGMLTASFLSTLAGVYMPGEYSLIHTVEVEFVKPVFIGDELVISGTVVEKSDLFKAIWLKVVIKNQVGKKVCRAKMRIGVLR